MWVSGLFSGGEEAIDWRGSGWGNTLLLSVSVSATALALAVPVAWLVAGAPRWVARVVTPASVCVLLTPPYVQAYAWDLVTSPQSWLGGRIYESKDFAAWVLYGGVRAWWVLSLWVWPVAALWLGHVFAGQGRWMMAQGLLDGTRRQVVWRLVLPSFWPHLLGAGCAMGALILTEFSVAHLYSVPVLATELLARWMSTSPGPIESVAWLSAPMGVVGVGAGLLIGYALSRVSAGEAGVVEMQPGVWARPGKIAWIVTGVVLLLALVWPVAALVGALGGAGRIDDPRVMVSHLKTTPWVAGLAALVCATVAVSTWSARRVRRRWVVVLLTTVTATLPAALVGASLAVGYVSAPAWITNSAWMVVSVCVARFGVVAVVVSWMALAGVPAAYAEMAELDGAGPWRRWWSVVAPQVWRPVAAGGAVVFALSASELAATGMTLPAGLRWLGQLMLNQMHYSRNSTVVVACLTVMGLVWVVTLGGFVLVWWGRPRTSPGLYR